MPVPPLLDFIKVTWLAQSEHAREDHARMYVVSVMRLLSLQRHHKFFAHDLRTEEH